MKQETLEEAAKNYAHKSFIWPLNKQGEKQSIPPGQLVPPGYAKHQKITTKYFINGAKWQQERMYSEEDMRTAWNSSEQNMRFNFSSSVYKNITFEQWFEQFKKE